MERNQSIHKFRHKMITPLQRDAMGVGWKLVESRPIQAGEGFEMLQSALLIKNMGEENKGEGAMEMPAHPQALVLDARSCGAVAVPRKKRGSPLVAARRRA